MKKNIFTKSLVAIMLAVSPILAGCSSSDDDLKVIGGNGSNYSVTIPASAYSGEGSFEVKEADEAQIAELKAWGVNVVGSPVSVTLSGNEGGTVFLEDYATVSFDIPSSIAREDYAKCLGVLMSKSGPVYMVPDAGDLGKGKVTFRTGHFTVCCMARPKDNEIATLFAKRTATIGWQKDVRNADLKKNFSEKMEEFMDGHHMGKNDLMGRVMRKIVENDELLSATSDLIQGKAGKDEAVQFLSKRMAEKSLEVLVGQLKSNPNDMEVKEAIEEHFNIDNANELAEKLGEGATPKSLAKDYAVKAAKEFSKSLMPCIETVETAAETVEFLTDLWADNVIEEGFEQYMGYGPGSNGNIRDDDWETLSTTYLAAALRYCKTNRNMTENEVREMFSKRVAAQKQIDTRQQEIEKMINKWQENFLLDRGYLRFDRDMDITVRLSILHNLTERFRNEFVKNGDIPGRHKYNSGLYSVDELIIEMITKYLEVFPDTRKFYDWAEENGFYGEQGNEPGGGYAWRLVRTEMESPDNDNNGIYANTYNASPLLHSQRNAYIYDGANDAATFIATCSACPPETMKQGDVIRMHVTIAANGYTTHFFGASADLIFDKAEVNRYGISTSAVRPAVENLVGSMNIGSHAEDKYHNGECDFSLTIPKGKEGEEWAVKFRGCGSDTRWIYKWCNE